MIDAICPYVLLLPCAAVYDDASMAVQCTWTRQAQIAAYDGGMTTPLHGERTHPLSPHAWTVLRQCAIAPVPRQTINPGVVNRLLRQDKAQGIQPLARIEMRPSPFRTHNGKLIAFVVLTEHGMQVSKGASHESTVRT